MPIISVIGRKQPKLRAVIIALYVLLTLGAVSMVYPFWLMVSMSFASYTDQHDLFLIPRYWRHDDALFQKYEESKYNESPDYFNQFLQSEMAAFKDLKPPQVNAAAVRDWQEFAKTLPPSFVDLAHQESASGITAESLSRYRRFLQARFHEDIKALNQAYGEVNADWVNSSVRYPPDHWEERQQQERDSRKYREFLEFKRGLAPRYRIPVSMDGMWWKWLTSKYGVDLEELGKRHGGTYASNSAVHLPERLPTQAKLAEDWVEFVRRECPLHYIVVTSQAAQPAFQEALRARYGDLAAFNKEHKTSYADWSQMKLSPTAPKDEAWRVDWMEFVTTVAPPQFLRLDTPEIRYRAWLAKKYGNVADLNQAYGTSYADLRQVVAPRLESDWEEMKADARAIRHEFLVRNYREVLQVIALHGRAVRNTFILVLATVLVTLTINPLAAYALSRYQLPATYKILLFLLATMAFPAEVTMIPNFLLLKSTHMLNTYWALILPGVANGMWIFILKGFFDSLPRELYEAAQIDGAREGTMFLRITLPLSKPVLAVIALGAFVGAYGGYMWAFLVCQDSKMWTIMVWLMQMDSWAPQFMKMASMVLIAIPTLLMFIFCQNIIMRGIILPVEK